MASHPKLVQFREYTGPQDCRARNVLDKLCVDTFSVVFNLADFAPEPRLGGPVWTLTVNGHQVDADGPLRDDEDDRLENHFTAYPVAAFDKTKTLMKYMTRLQVGRVYVTLEVWAEGLPGFDNSYGWEERWWCRVEANAARLTDPDGWQGCRVDIAAEVVCALIVHLGQRGIVTRACPHMFEAEHENDPNRMQYDRPGDALRRDEPLGHLFLSPDEALFQPVCLRWSCLNDAYCGLKLNRLDLCRDVRDVKDQAIWRAVVAGTRQPRLAHKDTRFDNYISASSGARGIRFVVYDKHSETAASNAPRTARPPEGTMRVEAQLHKDWLRNAGIRTPSDINPAHATRLFMKSYRWVGLDRAVGGTRRSIPQSRWMGRGPVKLRNWWRWLEDRAAELPDTSTRPTVIDNENLTRRGGYVVGLPPDSDLGPARRIDLQNGVEAAVTRGWAFHNDFTPWALRTVVRRR